MSALRICLSLLAFPGELGKSFAVTRHERAFHTQHACFPKCVAQSRGMGDDCKQIKVESFVFIIEDGYDGKCL